METPQSLLSHYDNFMTAPRGDFSIYDRIFAQVIKLS